MHPCLIEQLTTEHRVELIRSIHRRHPAHRHDRPAQHIRQRAGRLLIDLGIHLAARSQGIYLENDACSVGATSR